MVLQAPPDPREETPVEQTPSQIRNDELANWRTKVIADLRALADALESTTYQQFPTPDMCLGMWSTDEPTDDDPYNAPRLNFARIRKAMAALPGNWAKYQGDSHITYSKRFGDTVRIAFNVNRANVCERVQTGTKHVEAVAAHDEPVYEWRCNDTEPDV